MFWLYSKMGTVPLSPYLKKRGIVPFLEESIWCRQILSIIQEAWVIHESRLP